MKVDLIDHMGTDLTVVNAARVSMDKESKWSIAEGPMVVNNEFVDEGFVEHLSDQDCKLINYLAKHKHWTPFGHCFVQFRIKAPIFVARQLAKHQVGLVWNEVSRRYVDDDPEFFVPEVWRNRAENVKQGSGGKFTGFLYPSYFDHEGKPVSEYYKKLLKHASGLYEEMISQGVCPEQARMVLPQAMYTEWYWSGSLAAFARICKLRLDPHAQKETQFIAEEINKHMKDFFPVSWKALMEN